MKPLNPTMTEDILTEIFEERGRQDARWGEQNHPVRLDSLVTSYQSKLDVIRGLNECRARGRTLLWDAILLEEVYEAYIEEDGSLEQEAELVQAAAVIVAMIESVRRKREKALSTGT